MTGQTSTAVDLKHDPRLIEVMDEGVHRAVEWASDDAEDQAECFIGVAFTHGVDSPIERMFLAAFAPYAVMSPDYSISPQVPIGKYRVDFVVTFDPGQGVHERVVVECDGHDFHEKTKEQAEHDKRRDRFLTAEGYTVMRFTGRELWRDPFACVQEVIDFTQRGIG